MEYAIFTFDAVRHQKTIHNLKNSLSTWTENSHQFDYLFSVGGDGTFIKSAVTSFDKEIKIVGINSGKNSFLGTELTDDFHQKIQDDKRFFNFQVFKLAHNEQNFHSVNDVFISGNLFLECEIYINNQLLCLYRGYGLLLSTKLGCTAFNKSIEAPIIMPNSSSWVLSFLFPQQNKKFSNFYNPIVFSELESIQLKIISDNPNVFIDNQKITYNPANPRVSIEIISSKAKVFLPETNVQYLQKLKSHFLNS